ncbi:MAG TPA: VWA domain-containing protein [Pyrinomonadaceae bacterium]|nr:VWA domain-containing protein [Pyrinomonadaceae bacterium]
MTAKLFFIITVLFATVAFVAAQGKEDIIRVDTQLVDVPIAVSSANGTPLRGLTKSNFIIYEDGKRQETVDFSTTAAPFEVALLLDTSGSARNDLLLIQRAAKSFIASLRPGDRVAIVAFNTGRDSNSAFAVSEILMGLTSDRDILGGAIDNLKTSNGTPYYDSVIQVVEKVFRDKPKDEFRGRRALVALTDGVDSTSAESFATVKEELGQIGIISFFIKVDTREYFESNLLGDCRLSIRFSQAQIRRYYKSFNPKANMEKAVDFCGLGEFERLAISKKLYEIADAEMNELAKSSGGKVFPVADLSEARNAFKSVADEIGTKYTLGYYPSNDKRDGTYRKIRVEVTGLPKGTTVRAREGYTAPVN